jgi:hypothetical protein
VLVKTGTKGDVSMLVGADKVEVVAPADVPISIKNAQGSFDIDGQGNITIKGTKITLEGLQEVEIKAPQIAVTADAQLDLKSNGPAGMKGAVIQVESQGPLMAKGATVMIN